MKILNFSLNTLSWDLQNCNGFSALGLPTGMVVELTHCTL